MRHWLASAFTLAACALAAPLPALAQDVDIAALRVLISEVESGRTMILAPLGANAWGSLAVVERDRVGMIAGWLVTTGLLHPDSVPSWTRKQLAISRDALAIMQKELSDLEAQRPGAAAPPAVASSPTPPVTTPGTTATEPVTPPARPAGAARFPNPMEWRGVQGGIQGTYLIPCFAFPPVQGSFTLALAGDGSVRAEFEFNAEMIPASGTIRSEGERGIAEGSGRTPDDVAWVGYDTDTVPGGEYRWAVRLGRWNDAIILESGKVELVRLLPDYTEGCNPGTMRPLD